MIRFFFDRNSNMVKLMEAVGLFLIFLLFITNWFAALGAFNKVVFYFYIFEYIFIRTCAEIHWYKKAKRGEGIELQFVKALVPTSYILAITGLFLLMGITPILLYFSSLLLLIIAHVNVILLYLYLRDTDKFGDVSRFPTT